MMLSKTELSALSSLVNVTNASGVNVEKSGEETNWGGYHPRTQVRLSIGTKGVASDWQDSILDCIDDLTDFLDI